MKYRACAKCAASVGMVNVIGNTLMIALKGYMGIIGGSKGLIADAIHSCADLLATIVMIIGLKISGQEKDERYPYGYGKSEYIVAIIIYLFLLIIAFYILYDGTVAIIEKREVTPNGIAIWGATFSIMINELMFRQSVCAGTQINSPSMVAKAWESRSDVYSSVGVVIGIIGAKMGYHFMDPLAAVVVGVVIFKICIEMMKESILSLMDKVPESVEIDEIKKKAAARLQAVTVDVREIMVREIGDKFEFDIEVGVPDCLTIADGEGIKEDVRQAVLGLVERQAEIEVRLRPVQKGSV
jgi:cation diffusion facilitator family transporter